MRGLWSSAALAALGLTCGGPQAVNQPPVAFAGYDREAILGEVVALDGSSSQDPDGDALSYAWTVQAPDGSRAPLGGQALVTYQPLLEGVHLVFLRVDDGERSSPPDLLALRVRSQAPAAELVAQAGASHRIPPGGSALLDGAGSSAPAGADASLHWRVVDWPDGAELGRDFALVEVPGDPSAVTFTHLAPSAVGAFVVELRVSADGVESDPDYVTIGVDGWGDAVVAEAQTAARFAIGGGGVAPIAVDARLRTGSGSTDQTVEWWVLAAPEGEGCPRVGERLRDGASVEEVPPLTIAHLRFETACAGSWLLFVCPQGSAPVCPAPLDPSPACGERTALTASCCCGLGDRLMLTVEEVTP